jgi:uncharacterized hydrophobic protein (TIGR00271 family)
MGLRNRLRSIHWTLKRRWFGVWEVRNYYTTLEGRARAGAEITYGFILMVVASAVLATAGLLLDNPTVIIGAMCVAPFLGPSRAVCIGGLFGNWRIFLVGLAKQLLGLLIVGAGMAYLITTVLRATVPGIEITPEVLLRAMPTAHHVVLSVLIAVAAGAAASLALSADPHIVDTPWGQVIDAVIGVEIAISLIPPASVVGIGLAFQSLDVSRNAFLLLMVNVLGLDIIGSMLMLGLRGVRGRYLALEKGIRQTAESALAATPGVLLRTSVIDVTLLGDTAAEVHVAARISGSEAVTQTLAQTVAAAIQDKTGCRSEVMVEIIPSQSYSTFVSSR